MLRLLIGDRLDAQGELPNRIHLPAREDHLPAAVPRFPLTLALLPGPPAFLLRLVLRSAPVLPREVQKLLCLANLLPQLLSGSLRLRDAKRAVEAAV